MLLGAAGGSVRGVIDLYTSVLTWQEARRSFRAEPPSAEEEAPPFSRFFDPFADSIAICIHVAMGAGVAVLLGSTDQISGAYAALISGISAPAILTQIGRISSISEALGATPQDASGDPPASSNPAPQIAPNESPRATQFRDPKPSSEGVSQRSADSGSSL